jgi:DNA-directed RNA polymerase
VNENHEDILNFRNGKLINESDSKLLFIAFCFEYTNYFNSLFSNETFYISYFPIQLDATCNGYQHLSLLTGDESLASQLNLNLQDEHDIPNDFYDFVAIKMNDYLIKTKMEVKNKMTELNLNNKQYKDLIESYDKLLKLKKNRSLVKLPIMVKPYNATLLTMVEYIRDKLERILVDIEIDIDSNNDTIHKEIVADEGIVGDLPKDKKNKKIYMYKSKEGVILSNDDLILFVKTMEKVIYNEFPKLKQLGIYLDKIAKIAIILNISIS